MDGTAVHHLIKRNVQSLLRPHVAVITIKLWPHESQTIDICVRYMCSKSRQNISIMPKYVEKVNIATKTW